MSYAFAGAAAVVGGAFVAVSVYWGLGGTRLLDTVGSGIASSGNAQSGLALVASWGGAVAKAVAAVLPWLAVRTMRSARWQRPTRILAWIEGVVLTAYGGVLTTVGLLVQSGVIATGPHADHRALRWHAYVWDPWFLVWGLLVVAALSASRDQRTNRDQDQPQSAR
jgi:Protein of unknown function (DUF3995)